MREKTPGAADLHGTVRTPADGARGARCVWGGVFKKGMGLDFTISRKNTNFVIFRKKYFGRKPLRDERYGDGSATAETGRSGRFFLY